MTIIFKLFIINEINLSFGRFYLFAPKSPLAFKNLIRSNTLTHIIKLIKLNKLAKILCNCRKLLTLSQIVKNYYLKSVLLLLVRKNTFDFSRFFLNI